jgi:hypothetical protein
MERDSVSKEAPAYMTGPVIIGTLFLPRRDGPKGLLPSIWMKHALRLEYVVCGELRETTETLLDVYSAGPVVNAGGARTLIAWATIAGVELVED